jgi:hypothetical protein
MMSLWLVGVDLEFEIVMGTTTIVGLPRSSMCVSVTNSCICINLKNIPDFFKMEKKLEAYKPHLREATKKTYIANIKRSKRILKTDAFEKNAKKVEQLKLAPSIKKTLVTAMITFEKMNGRECPQLSVLLKQLDKQSKAAIAKQKMSRKDQQRWLTLDDIAKVRKKVEDEIKLNDHWEKASKGKLKSIHKIQLLLLMTWYSHFQTRNEIGTVQVISSYKYNTGEKLKGNYMVIGAKKSIFFSFAIFKTSKAFQKKFGLPVILKPNKRFTRLLNRYMKVKPDTSDALFFDSEGKPLLGARGRNLITTWLKSIFLKYLGKQISTNMIRKAWIKSVIGDDTSLEKQTETMKGAMQTSLFTMHTYARS